MKPAHLFGYAGFSLDEIGAFFDETGTLFAAQSVTGARWSSRRLAVARKPCKRLVPASRFELLTPRV
jgi:hypothetical protein